MFDVVAGFEAGVEPSAIDYSGNVARWSARLATVGGEVDKFAYENPSGFAREQLVGMVVFARHDLDSIADVVPRLLFVADVDDNTLNRIEALEGLGDFLYELGFDPLSTKVGEPRTAATRSALFERLGELSVERRARSLSETERRTIGELLSDAIAAPMDTHAADRELVRVLHRLWRAENDSRLRTDWQNALIGAIGNAGTRSATVALRSPEVRIRAVGANFMHRLAGARAVPVVLQRLSRSDGVRAEYSPAVQERRMLLRMCSSLKGDELFASHDAGPRPIDFLYDTVSRDEDEGLRFVALEAMARCLGRPVSFDRDWADAWWREFSLEDGGV